METPTFQRNMFPSMFSVKKRWYLPVHTAHMTNINSFAAVTTSDLKPIA
jgi:hypothetical protein